MAEPTVPAAMMAAMIIAGVAERDSGNKVFYDFVKVKTLNCFATLQTVEIATLLLAAFRRLKHDITEAIDQGFVW